MPLSVLSEGSHCTPRSDGFRPVENVLVIFGYNGEWQFACVGTFMLSSDKQHLELIDDQQLQI